MKLGCRNDPLLRHLDPQLQYFDEHSYHTDHSYDDYADNSFDSTDIIASTPTNSNSCVSDLSFVDNAVRNIMQHHSIIMENDSVVNDDAMTNIKLMKYIISSLHDQLLTLKDELIFI